MCQNVREREHGFARASAEAPSNPLHLFVCVPGFSTAPFDVRYALLDDVRPLPTLAPEVPGHRTDIWMTGTMTSGLVYHWTRGRGWSYFDRSVSAPQAT